MIIVSGEPRSGTSLMMETLRILGLEIWGEEQPGEHLREIGRQKQEREETFEEKLQREKAKDLNEKFWEIGGLVMKGFQPYSMARNKFNIQNDPMLLEEDKKKQLKIIENVIKQYEDHKNHAVKIIWNGIIRTDLEVLSESKIILCLRDPLHIAKSQQRLESQAKVVAVIDGKEVFISPEQPMSPFRYLKSASQFILWHKTPEHRNLNILKIAYDDMQFKSAETIQKIANFLDLEIPKDKIKEAILNIDPSKRRSAIVEQPKDNKEEWVLVGELHEAIADGEYDLAESRIKEYQEFQKTNPNNARWLDEETFFPIDVELYRSMQKNDKLKQNMIKSKKNREAGKIICTACPLYNNDGDLYTIKLPSDLDDIVRTKVRCKELETDVTLEDCQRHWQSIQYNPNKLKCLKNTTS